MPGKGPCDGRAPPNRGGDPGDGGATRGEALRILVPGRNHLQVYVGGRAAVADQPIPPLQNVLDDLPLIDEQVAAPRANFLRIPLVPGKAVRMIEAVIGRIEGVRQIEQPMIIKGPVIALRAGPDSGSRRETPLISLAVPLPGQASLGMVAPISMPDIDGGPGKTGRGRFAC